MKRFSFLWIALLGMAVMSGSPLSADSFRSGGFIESNTQEDKLNFGLGGRFTIVRRKVKVPPAYGRLVSITDSKNGANFWFESEDGSIRNVKVDSIDSIVVVREGEMQTR